MARYSHPSSFDFYQQSPTSLEAKPAFPEEDEISVLDDKILDSTTSPELSSIDNCRPSYVQDAFSHRDSIWSSDFSQSRHNSQAGPSMFDPTNPFAPPSTSYAQHNAWSLRESGSCTPNALYDGLPADLDNANSSAPFSGGAVGPVSAIPPSMPSYRNMAFGAGAVPMSPQSSHGWMPASTDMPDAISRPTRSPRFRHTSPLSVRRDGIRKKNARFDIPAERTLNNIDDLIKYSKDEEEIKELKQQKRLLRNRQAALDSRQRKKIHTEKLEEEKKQFSHIIADLEDSLREMKMREANLLREKSEWMGAQQQINQYIEGMHMEKEELIRVHTLDSAELRKRNNILKETVEKLERQTKSAPAVSHDFSELENLTLDNSSWDEFGMVHALESDSIPQSTQSSAMVVDKTPEKDHPFSWNAFYMCLLFGAFVASNSASLSQRPMPQMSEEYRAESANVLKAVLNSSPPELAQNNPSGVAPSAAAAASLPATITGAEMAQMSAGNNLDDLHHSLTMPSKEQEQEQVFSLNADQYNSLTTFDDANIDYKSQQPSNLQQAYANMRAGKLPSRTVSDAHSRSLMWDRVPDKVIRDFRRMVQEYGTASAKEE